MILGRMIRTGLKQAKSRRGFALIEVMLVSAVLVVATTASLQIYLQTSMLVRHTRERTVAVSHQKMAMEYIRSWKTLNDDDIISCKQNTGGWQSWLLDQVPTNTAGEKELLDNELIVVTSEDWVTDFPTSPRRVVVKITWDGVRGASEALLVGGFF